MTQIVKLNVGGIPYVTSVSTLTQYRDSMLGAMVEQQHEQNLIREGKELFIDRNGQIFEYVLEYLRNADKTILPEDASTLRKLLLESEFYLLGGLTALISNKLEALKEKPKWQVGDIICKEDLRSLSLWQIPFSSEVFNNRNGDLVGTIMEINAARVVVKFTGSFLPKGVSDLDKYCELSAFRVFGRGQLGDKPIPSN